ncbi:MAG: ABC transporter permease [Bacillota bacterium]|jgi:peptide/nickel transport system permease protein|nr:ABC transporter permease [Bacillota bacterium]
MQMASDLPTIQDPSVETSPSVPKRRDPKWDNLIRFGKYFITRFVILGLTVIVATYLSILIANMGGAVDKIREAQIKTDIGLATLSNPEIMQLPPEMRREYEAELYRLEAERLGLDRPFLVRSVEYLKNAVTLNLGYAEYIKSETGSQRVSKIILERLPFTLLLTMSSFLLMFFLTLFFGLYLSRNYGSFLDKLVTALAPAYAPAWFYGIFLILIFAAILKLFPFGGVVKAPPPESKIQYALSVLHHLTLPLTASVLSGFFLGAYSRRTFFLIYSEEDYVEMAKAKGLSARAIERRYILRPTLPPIITGFALALIGQWVGATILETVFNWPGLGRLLREAIGLYDTPVIVGEAVIYGYLLAATVFLLDIIYAIVDPRVKVGAGGGQ